MKRLAPKLALGLLMVVFFASPSPKHVPIPPPSPVRSYGTLPVMWDVLGQAIVDQGRFYASAVSAPVPVSLPKHATPRGSTSTAECIGQRENGGDYGRSSNPTHFGKYQYDRATWMAHGGNPDDWGTASPDEQERVFANGTARYGYSAWTRYDGC